MLTHSEFNLAQRLVQSTGLLQSELFPEELPIILELINKNLIRTTGDIVPSTQRWLYPTLQLNNAISETIDELFTSYAIRVLWDTSTPLDSP